MGHIAPLKVMPCLYGTMWRALLMVGAIMDSRTYEAMVRLFWSYFKLRNLHLANRLEAIELIKKIKHERNIIAQKPIDTSNKWTTVCLRCRSLLENARSVLGADIVADVYIERSCWEADLRRVANEAWHIDDQEKGIDFSGGRLYITLTNGRTISLDSSEWGRMELVHSLPRIYP